MKAVSFLLLIIFAVLWWIAVEFNSLNGVLRDILQELKKQNKR